MLTTAFLIVAIVLFVLAAFGVDGRCQPAWDRGGLSDHHA